MIDQTKPIDDLLKMANELIRPIDPVTARAIEEAAKTAGKAIDASPPCSNHAKFGGVDFRPFTFADALALRPR
jgi:hypothetical protein